ncbi:thioredoxin domain-containing protein [Salinisphaera sp. LB1]|uniref:DsbA family protein n=1 Tax=Salinisphaera sp. LB1 TaxID=2183911 RepID=UPI000FF7DEC3|nr:thioredoxin domain-containing protein [Salinisphaera sp. LB1]
MSQQDETKQSSLYGVFFFPVIALFVLIIAVMLLLSYRGNSRAAYPARAGISEISPQTMKQLRNAYDVYGESVGNPKAAVTVREFAGYQCPACGHFEPIAERIRKRYIKTGNVRFIFFDSPLSMHSHTQAAAGAARCAAQQHEFWRYHDRLYQTQSQWAQAADPTSQFVDIGAKIGLNRQKLKACMKANKTLPALKAERQAGQAVKIQATPTVMVNRTEFVGAPSYQELNKTIESALANAGEAVTPQE